MKIQIFLILLISFIFGGCSILSPFKAINSCSDTKNNGANCESIESNLEYSIKQDTPKTPISDNVSVLNPDDAEKDEIARLIIGLNISPDTMGQPVYLQPSSYRVLIYPYAVGNKYYSARYVYIMAGKPGWVDGNKAIFENKTLRLNTPPRLSKPLSDDEKIQSINISKKNDEKEKYVVIAYLLNCRQSPTIESPILTSIEYGTIFDVESFAGDWAKFNYNGFSCYSHSSFLESYNESFR